MAVLDIRSAAKHEIDVIKFSDDELLAQRLVKGGNSACPEANLIIDGDGWEDSYTVPVCKKEDALNLAAALKKAVDLGWFD